MVGDVGEEIIDPHQHLERLAPGIFPVRRQCLDQTGALVGAQDQVLVEFRDQVIDDKLLSTRGSLLDFLFVAGLLYGREQRTHGPGELVLDKLTRIGIIRCSCHPQLRLGKLPCRRLDRALAQPGEGFPLVRVQVASIADEIIFRAEHRPHLRHCAERPEPPAPPRLVRLVGPSPQRVPAWLSRPRPLSEPAFLRAYPGSSRLPPWNSLPAFSRQAGVVSRSAAEPA